MMFAAFWLQLALKILASTPCKIFPYFYPQKNVILLFMGFSWGSCIMGTYGYYCEMLNVCSVNNKHVCCYHYYSEIMLLHGPNHVNYAPFIVFNRWDASLLTESLDKPSLWYIITRFSLHNSLSISVYR